MSLLSVWAKILLFCSAYIPLFLIIIIKNWNTFILKSNFIYNDNIFHLVKHHPIYIFKKISNLIIDPVFILIITCVIAVLFLHYLLTKQSAISPKKLEIIEVKNRTSDTLNYILTFIIPFLSLNLTNYTDIFCILLLLVTISVVYINSNLLYINPVLNLMGYTTFEINGKILNNEKEEDGLFLIAKNTRKSIRKGNTIDVSIFDNGIYFTENL